MFSGLSSRHDGGREIQINWHRMDWDSRDPGRHKRASLLGMDDDGVGPAPATYLVGPNLCPATHGFRIMDREDHPCAALHIGQGQMLEPRDHLGLKMNDVWRATHHCSAQRRGRWNQLHQSQGVEASASKCFDFGTPPPIGKLETGITEPLRTGLIDDHPLLPQDTDQKLGVAGETTAVRRICDQNAELRSRRRSVRYEVRLTCHAKS